MPSQDALATGRKVRTLSIEGAYPRQLLTIEVDTSLPALRVVHVLDKLRVERARRDYRQGSRRIHWRQPQHHQSACEETSRTAISATGRPETRRALRDQIGSFVTQAKSLSRLVRLNG